MLRDELILLTLKCWNNHKLFFWWINHRSLLVSERCRFPFVCARCLLIQLHSRLAWLLLDGVTYRFTSFKPLIFQCYSSRRMCSCLLPMAALWVPYLLQYLNLPEKRWTICCLPLYLLKRDRHLDDDIGKCLQRDVLFLIFLFAAQQ